MWQMQVMVIGSGKKRVEEGTCTLKVSTLLICGPCPWFRPVRKVNQQMDGWPFIRLTLHYPRRWS